MGKDNCISLSFEERTVAKWIGYSTGKNEKSVDLIRADSEAIREEYIKGHNTVKRILSVNIFEVARQIMQNEKDVFDSYEKILKVIFGLIRKDIVDVSRFYMPLIQTDYGSDPNTGSYEYGNPEIFVRLPRDLY
jgi:hypothetical protein